MKNTNTTEKQETIDNLLTDLVAIATHHKPGQVTHKIADIKEFWKDNEQSAVQKAREETALAILKDVDKVLYQIIGEENYQISYKDSHALWNKYLPSGKAGGEKSKEHKKEEHYDHCHTDVGCIGCIGHCSDCEKQKIL